jgi:hypothetical protein
MELELHLSILVSFFSERALWTISHCGSSLALNLETPLAQLSRLEVKPCHQPLLPRRRHRLVGRLELGRARRALPSPLSAADGGNPTPYAPCSPAYLV